MAAVTVKKPGRRGTCPVCGAEVGLLDDGTIRNHYQRAEGGRKVGANRAWCPGTRKQPAGVRADPEPVDEDDLLLELVEVIDRTLTSDAAGVVNIALPLREFLLARYDIREKVQQ